MITHLEPEILEPEVKWALGSITTNQASRFPAELIPVLKDDAVQVLQYAALCSSAVQCASKYGKFSSGHRTGKGQYSFQSQRKEMPKNAQTTTQLHSSHTLAK